MAKQKWKQRITTVRTLEGPTKERRNQDGGVYAELIGRPVDRVLVKRYRAVSQSPLDVYKDLGVITEPEHEAGREFRRAYFAAVLSRPAFEERISLFSTMREPTMSEQELQNLHRTMPASEFGAVIDVCGHEVPAWDRKRFEALKKGLGHLALRWNMMALELCEHKRVN